MILSLDPKLKENLYNKLEKLLLHFKKLQTDKKNANKSFKEQMAACDDKIQAIAQALQTGDETYLADAFDQYEIEVLNK